MGLRDPWMLESGTPECCTQCAFQVLCFSPVRPSGRWPTLPLSISELRRKNFLYIYFCWSMVTISLRAAALRIYIDCGVEHLPFWVTLNYTAGNKNRIAIYIDEGVKYILYCDFFVKREFPNQFGDYCQNYTAVIIIINACDQRPTSLCRQKATVPIRIQPTFTSDYNCSFTAMWTAGRQTAGTWADTSMFPQQDRYWIISLANIVGRSIDAYQLVFSTCRSTQMAS